jgi:DNA-binding MarR family transcriptional regulator
VRDLWYASPDANYPHGHDYAFRTKHFSVSPTRHRRAAATDAILGHFASLMQRLAGWHAPEFLGVDVTMSQAKCLYVAAVRPGIGMSALAEQLQVGLSAVSGLVDRLVDHGYLVRHEDPADRRQQQVSVTAAGAAALDRIRELNAELLRTLLQGLSVPELEAMRQGISALDREARILRPDTLANADQSHERTS